MTVTLSGFDVFVAVWLSLNTLLLILAECEIANLRREVKRYRP